MKLTTLKKRIEKLADNTLASKDCFSTLNVRRNSAAYKLLNNWDGKSLIRPAWYLGSGRYTTVQDHTDSAAAILTACKVKYEIGNDAARGGVYGKYIKIKTTIELK